MSRKIRRFFALTPALLGLVLLASPGCQRGESGGGAPPVVSDDVWEVICVQGDKVGFQHASIEPVTDAGQPLRQIDSQAEMNLSRDGHPITVKWAHRATETPAGLLLGYVTETHAGSARPMIVKGRIDKGRLTVETETAGKTATETVDWPADTFGVLGVEQSLARSPMKPGEHRTLRVLIPEFNQAGNIELIARDYESTKLLDGSAELLKIENHIVVGGRELPQAWLWTDRSGKVQKNRTDMLQMETFRTTKEVATAQAAPAKFDLWTATFVQPDKSLARPHVTRRVRYEVYLDSDDPAKVFPSGPTQHVKSLDAHTAQLTVEAVRPGEPAKAPADDPPTDGDRLPNSLIQSDNAKVVALSREVAAAETDPWRVAVALESLVNARMQPRDLSQGFATAADVAADLSGDCTEYGVLLAGLCRARGIPARVAVGLVYTPQGFGFHLWTEAWITDRWIPLDATLGRGGIGAAHLKLAHSNLKGVSAFTGFIPVAQVLGHLKIRILEVDGGQ